MEPSEPTRPPIDRELISRDLGHLAQILAPLVEARLPSGAMALMAMGGLPPVASLVADSLRRVLDLSDDDLAELIDAFGVELGAWRGLRRPLGSEYATAHPKVQLAATRLVATLT